MNFNKLFKRVAIAVFILGLITLAAGFGFQQIKLSANETHPKLKIFYSQIYYPNKNNEGILQVKIERLVKPDGSWKETKTILDREGNVLNKYDTFAINGQGVFVVDNKEKRLIFQGERPDALPAFNADDIRKSENFVGEGSILNYKTLIQRIPDGDAGYTEFHIAPELNGQVLKTVFAGEDSSTVIEVTNIDAKPYTDESFGSMPDYPVFYESYKNKIRMTESIGKKDEADRMKKNLP